VLAELSAAQTCSSLPPAVIDFSPLERPAGLPLAVVAVDTLMWHRASPEVLGYLSGEPELGQLLAHALVYRLVTEIVRHAGTAGVDAAHGRAAGHRSGTRPAGRTTLGGHMHVSCCSV
jgi:hypothetical protein